MRPILTRAAAPVARGLLFALFAVLATFAASPSAATTDAEVRKRAEDIEIKLLGFPRPMLTELEALVPQAGAADAGTRRFVDALHGQALVQAGRNDAALELADRLDSEGRRARDDAQAAIALLIRSSLESRAGDESQANALANEGRNLAAASSDNYVRFWAALAVGVSARMLGRSDEALTNLQEAYALADASQNPYRRANALYWLSVLHAVPQAAGRGPGRKPGDVRAGDAREQHVRHGQGQGGRVRRPRAVEPAGRGDRRDAAKGSPSRAPRIPKSRNRSR